MTLAAALIAFGHFLAFFVLAAALVVQLTLLRGPLGVESAQRIRRADRAMAVGAILVLLFGALRVFWFEKGSAFYFGNFFFDLKLLLFLAGAVISQFPSAEYRRWSASLAQGTAPVLDEARQARLRGLIHWQLIVIMGILLCASLMAKGIGY